MGYKVTQRLAPQLRAISERIPRELQKELKRGRKKMTREQLEFLSREALQTFDQQRDPRGRFWKRPSPLNLALRQRAGFQGRDAGVGPKKVLRNSFKLRNKYNIGREHRGQLHFGSKIRRGGHNVGEVFSKRFIFYSAILRRNAIHPARPILMWTPGWLKGLSEIAAKHMLKAAQEVYGKVAREAARA